MNTTRFAPSRFSMSQLPFIDYLCEEQSASTTRYKQGDPPFQVCMFWTQTIPINLPFVEFL